MGVFTTARDGLAVVPGPATASVTDEVALARLTELLVLREHDAAWWDSLARRTDLLAAAIAAHETDPALHCLASVSGDTAGAAVRRLHEEHEDIGREISELRALVVSARTEPHGASQVLAAVTEVIALVRGHNRRARELLSGAA